VFSRNFEAGTSEMTAKASTPIGFRNCYAGLACQMPLRQGCADAVAIARTRPFGLALQHFLHPVLPEEAKGILARTWLQSSGRRKRLTGAELNNRTLRR
jgi:hypothetical protein